MITDTDTMNTLAQVRIDIAGLVGRMDQVIIDHRTQIDKNTADIAQEKRDRMDEIRRLEDTFTVHSEISGRERATLHAHVADLQNDSREFRERFNAIGPRVTQIMSAIAAVAGIGIAIWAKTGG